MAATMAILNSSCFKSTLNTPNSKPTTNQTKPISLLSITSLPKGQMSSNAHASTTVTAGAGAGVALAGAFFSSLSSCEPAIATQQIAQIAEAGDNRGLALLIPIIPAIAWVLFNILQPALNQLNRMRSEKAVVAGIGLGGLAWAAVPPSEVAAVADAAPGDNRGTLLLFVVLPAIAWVLYNILQPALNQLNRMRSQ